MAVQGSGAPVARSGVEAWLGTRSRRGVLGTRSSRDLSMPRLGVARWLGTRRSRRGVLVACGSDLSDVLACGSDLSDVLAPWWLGSARADEPLSLFGFICSLRSIRAERSSGRVFCRSRCCHQLGRIHVVTVPDANNSQLAILSSNSWCVPRAYTERLCRHTN